MIKVSKCFTRPSEGTRAQKRLRIPAVGVKRVDLGRPGEIKLDLREIETHLPGFRLLIHELSSKVLVLEGWVSSLKMVFCCLHYLATNALSTTQITCQHQNPCYIDLTFDHYEQKQNWRVLSYTKMPQMA
jgi:hypothetical protein